MIIWSCLQYSLFEYTPNQQTNNRNKGL